MRIAIGSDHRGLEMKKQALKLLAECGHRYHDFGTHNSDPVDYPDIAGRVAEAVASGEFERGILVCGTGIGMCIAANKIKGIRAAVAHDVFTATRARQHNDANVLCLAGEDDSAPLPEILGAFLTGEFEGGRHQRRLDKIKDMEQ